MAGGQGFEPRQAESESAVLPLDDPPALWDEPHKIEKSAYYVKGKSQAHRYIGTEAQSLKNLIQVNQDGFSLLGCSAFFQFLCSDQIIQKNFLPSENQD